MAAPSRNATRMLLVAANAEGVPVGHEFAPTPGDIDLAKVIAEILAAPISREREKGGPKVRGPRASKSNPFMVRRPWRR